MAEERARLPSRRTSSEWTRERVALWLGTRRDKLIDRLPRELAAARGLTRDEMELVVDEAIDFMVTEYGRPVENEEFLNRAFWATAAYRVKRVHEGRSATVRAGFRRVDVEDAELAAATPDPASSAVEHVERQILLEFITTLTEPERQVLSEKYGPGGRERGRITIARELGLTSAHVRKIERSLTRKLERFVAVVSAGTLCAHRMPQVLALADERIGADEARAARAHLAYCPACRNEYILRLRSLRSGDLPRRLAELLPVPPTVGSRRWRSGIWDTVSDWATRPFAPDAANAGAQAAAGARGLGTAAAIKLVALCIGGAAAVGGGALCVKAITDDGRPSRPVVPRSKLANRGSRQTPREPRLPTAGRAAAVRVASNRTASSTRHRTIVKQATPKATPVSTPAPTATFTTAQHEQATAISPPASTASSAGEFDPAPASTAKAAPAAPATGGGPEFP